MGITGNAFAQGFSAVLIYDFSVEPPLTDQCIGGNPIPDGYSVDIYWDADDDGPDADDQQPVVGLGPGECNYNSFPMAGEEYFGQAGGFATDPAFSMTTVPEPSRFWLRVWVGDEERCLRSNSFTISGGFHDYYFTFADFICTDSPCGACEPPPPATALVATNNTCQAVSLSWNPYPQTANVNTLRILRDGEQIATVPWTETSFVDNGGPTGTSTYELIAARDCGPGDTALSAPVVTLGTASNEPLSAPQVVILPQGNDIVLMWNPVDTTIAGCPVVGKDYLIYISDTPEGPFDFLAWTSDTNFMDAGVIEQLGRRYYQVTADKGVQFADPNLEQAVREQLGNFDGPLLRGDLAGIVYLDAEYRNIQDISGVEWLTGLLTLALGWNQILDISGLSTLTQLQYLYLPNNQILDISGLSTLTQLQYLYLPNNQILDISGLSTLTQLPILWVGGNQISDISSLSALAQLQFLYLSGNQISDVQGLVDNVGLDSGDAIYLQFNPLSEIALTVQIPELINRGVNVFYGGAARLTGAPDEFKELDSYEERKLESYLNDAHLSDSHRELLKEELRSMLQERRKQ